MVTGESMYGKNVTIAGWGKLLYDEIVLKVNTAYLTVLTAQECQARYFTLSRRNIRLPDGIICTAANPFVLAANVSINLQC
jgi:hypothetical protein